MRLLLLAQIFIYLGVAPLFDSSVQLELSVFFITFSFLLFFLMGSYSIPQQAKSENQYQLELNSIGLIIFYVYVGYYSFTILSLDLFNRRQGAEYMALVFSQISILDLLVIRVFELIFWPISILFFLSFKSYKKITIFFFIFAFLLGLVFSGTFGSRSKLAISIGFMFIFLPLIKDKSLFTLGLKQVSLILLGMAIVIPFISSFFFVRGDNFLSFYDYLQTDVFERLNGLYISNELIRSYHPWLGSWDFSLFQYFTASIPFLESSSELKSLGLTSSKNYLLRDVLESPQYDVNNSIVSDPFYLSGIFGVMLIGYFYGFLAKQIDLIILRRTFFNSKFAYVIMIVIIMNLIRLESDFFGIFITFVRDIIIIYPLILIFSRFRNESYR